MCMRCAWQTVISDKTNVAEASSHGGEIITCKRHIPLVSSAAAAVGRSLCGVWGVKEEVHGCTIDARTPATHNDISSSMNADNPLGRSLCGEVSVSGHYKWLTDISLCNTPCYTHR